MKKLFLMVLFLVAFPFLSFSANASTTKVVLNTPKPQSTAMFSSDSDISIYNRKIISQNNNQINISFDIINGQKVQPQIKYGIKLTKSGDDSVLYDVKYFDEVLSFSGRQSLSENIIYTAPVNISGKYKLWIMLTNLNGLEMVSLPVGEVELNSSFDGVLLSSESCYLTVDKEVSGTKYLPRQGVDIAVEEKIIAHCKIVNNSGGDISLFPAFSVFRRSVSGDLLKNEIDENQNILIKTGEIKEFSLYLPLEKTPQAYDVLLSLVDSSKKTISNSVVFHYVLRGSSATIQNVLLDKDYYLKGDIAKLSFFWTPSADSFWGSRAGTSTKINTAEANIKIFDSSSIDCIDDFSKKLGESSESLHLDLNIIKECKNPTVSVVLKDGNNVVLDSKIFEINSAGLFDWNKTVAVALLFLIVIACLVVVVRGKKNFTISAVVLFLALSIPTYSFAEQVYFIASEGTGITTSFYFDRPPEEDGISEIYQQYLSPVIRKWRTYKDNENIQIDITAHSPTVCGNSYFSRQDIWYAVDVFNAGINPAGLMPKVFINTVSDGSGKINMLNINDDWAPIYTDYPNPISGYSQSELFSLIREAQDKAPEYGAFVSGSMWGQRQVLPRLPAIDKKIYLSEMGITYNSTAWGQQDTFRAINTYLATRGYNFNVFDKSQITFDNQYSQTNPYIRFSIPIGNFSTVKLDPITTVSLDVVNKLPLSSFANYLGVYNTTETYLNALNRVLVDKYSIAQNKWTKTEGTSASNLNTQINIQLGGDTRLAPGDHMISLFFINVAAGDHGNTSYGLVNFPIHVLASGEAPKSLSAVPPSDPVISGPSTASFDAPWNYTISATDPVGGGVQFDIDWNNDGSAMTTDTADQFLPEWRTSIGGWKHMVRSSYPSDMPVSSCNIWTTADGAGVVNTANCFFSKNTASEGVKCFKVRTVADSSLHSSAGLYSNWVEKCVTVGKGGGGMDSGDDSSWYVEGMKVGIGNGQSEIISAVKDDDTHKEPTGKPSPLKIQKTDGKYRIPLVPIGDPMASKIHVRIDDSGSNWALRKLK
ncbi:MAG: hypothetical protein WCO84_04845 [bacterium]